MGFEVGINEKLDFTLRCSVDGEMYLTIQILQVIQKF